MILLMAGQPEIVRYPDGGCKGKGPSGHERDRHTQQKWPGACVQQLFFTAFLVTASILLLFL